MSKKYQFDPEYYNTSYANYLGRNPSPLEWAHIPGDISATFPPNLPPTYQPAGDINGVVPVNEGFVEGLTPNPTAGITMGPETNGATMAPLESGVKVTFKATGSLVEGTGKLLGPVGKPMEISGDIIKSPVPGPDIAYCSRDEHYIEVKSEEDVQVKEEGISTLKIVLISVAIGLMIVTVIGVAVANKELGLKGALQKGGFALGVGIVELMVPLALALVGYFVYTIWQDKKAWCYDKNHKNELKIYRTTKRGEFVSYLLISSAIVQAAMKSAGAEPNLLLILYGFIFAAVIGYMGDKLIGTDEGFEAFNGKPGEGTAFMLGSMSSSSFFRYGITVLLDMFISAPIQAVMNYAASGFINKLTTRTTGISFFDNVVGKWTSLMGQNFDNLLQSFIATITFLAYTNETRFLWAYPSPSLFKKEMISTETIKVIVATAGVGYLIANYANEVFTKGSSIGGAIASDNVADIMGPGRPMGALMSEKLIYVLVAIVILTIGSYKGLDIFSVTPETQYNEETKVVKEVVNGEEVLVAKTVLKKNKLETANDVKNKWKKGLIIFSVLFFVGFLVPLWMNVSDNSKLVWGTRIVSAIIYVAVIIAMITKCKQYDAGK